MQAHHDGHTVTDVTVRLNETAGDTPFAVIIFGPVKIYAESAADARDIIAAGFEAMTLLDPGSPLGRGDTAIASLLNAGAEPHKASCGHPADPETWPQDTGHLAAEVPANRAGGRKCGRCGASQRDVAIAGDGNCVNTGACGRRQAAAVKAGG